MNPIYLFMRKLSINKRMQDVNISYPVITNKHAPVWLDLILFKLSWIALVVFQSQALIPVLGILALKIFFWPEISRFVPIIVLTFIAGIVMDSLLIVLGVFIFPAKLLPLWLVMLWAALSLTLPRGFSFMQHFHPLLQSCIGMMAGCVGYFSGYLLKAVSFGFPLLITMGIIALLWAILVPSLFKISSSLLKNK